MEDTYQEYPFVIKGTVYATSESHASHFVYWALEDALKYQDASHASIRFDKRELDAGKIPAPKPATEHIAFGK